MRVTYRVETAGPAHETDDFARQLIEPQMAERLQHLARRGITPVGDPTLHRTSIEGDELQSWVMTIDVEGEPDAIDRAEREDAQRNREIDEMFGDPPDAGR